jgi:hypothetical protein
MKTITLKLSFLLSVIYFVTGTTVNVSAQFVPGEGGVLPAAPVFSPLPNTVPGLYISTIQRMNYSFIGGTYNEVTLQFPTPANVGASSFVLQAFNTTTSRWENFKHQGEDVITTNGYSFSVITEKPEKFRLLLVGGEKGGWTTNEVDASFSGVNTYFSRWSLDESMWISGIMTPYVGRGLQASFTVSKLEDNSAVENALTYQWYRVNPATFEFIKIEGATDATYITTNADAAYALAIKATGNNVNAGGFVQVLSNWPNVHQVKAYVSNISESGFTLNLFNKVNDIDTSYFLLVDKNYSPVKITSITKGENNAIYNFSALLKPENAPYTLTNNWENAKYWHFASEMFPGHLMPMINIEFPSAIDIIDNSAVKIYPQPAERYFNFSCDENIKTIVVYNFKGEIVKQYVLGKKEGTLSTEDLSSGLYLLRFETSTNIYNKRLIINK